MGKSSLELMHIVIRVRQRCVEEKMANEITRETMLFCLGEKIRHNMAQVVLDLDLLSLLLFYTKTNDLIQSLHGKRPGSIQRKT